ncbi:hypothetical protein SJAV_00150 [Sulfurisphaera javensis]|uniref:PIN domain-containing protein n=1 Tax=Sulfurisphaera javensis TaxID=2049879 RepID=A0AAT9GMK0_9CREN
MVDTNVLVYDFISDSHEEAKKKLNVIERMVLRFNILVKFILMVITKLKIYNQLVKEKVEEILKNSVIVRVRKEDFIDSINLNIKN